MSGFLSFEFLNSQIFLFLNIFQIPIICKSQMSEDRSAYPFSTFLDQHSGQLNASDVPPELWHSLYKKLSDQTFDAGDHFQIICEMNEDDEKTLFVRALEDLHNNDEDK